MSSWRWGTSFMPSSSPMAWKICSKKAVTCSTDSFVEMYRTLRPCSRASMARPIRKPVLPTPVRESTTPMLPAPRPPPMARSKMRTGLRSMRFFSGIVFLTP